MERLLLGCGSDYGRCATLFVQEFVGVTNMLPGAVIQAGDGHATVAVSDGQTVEAVTLVRSLQAGQPVTVCIRPENLVVAAEGTQPGFPVTVENVLPLGPTVLYDVVTPAGTRLKLRQPREMGTATLMRAERRTVAPRGPGAYVAYPAAAEGATTPAA